MSSSNKINTGDFDGAITNARSLIESVLLYIEHELTGSNNDYDGNLTKLNKEVARLLNITANRNDECLRQIVTGLISVICGIAALRNSKSDAHGKSPKKYKPSRHHAILAANAAFTISDFYQASYAYKQDRCS